MPKILNIITRTDELAAEVIQREEKELPSVTTADLTVKNPDYDRLLDQVFDADSVHVW